MDLVVLLYHLELLSSQGWGLSYALEIVISRYQLTYREASMLLSVVTLKAVARE